MRRRAMACMVVLAGLGAACSSSSPGKPAADALSSGPTSTATPAVTATAAGAAPAPSGATPTVSASAGSKPRGSASPSARPTAAPPTAGNPQPTATAPGDPGNGDGNGSISVGPVITLTPDTSVSTNSSPGAPPPTVAPGPVNNLGITDVQMSTSLASDGSAANPQTVFSAASDPIVIAVATLANLPAGTQINYVHIFGSSYTPSATFTLKQPLKHFYIQFKAPAGGTLPKGSYRIRYYVNQQPAYDFSYTIQ